MKKLSRDNDSPGVGSFSSKYISNAFWVIHRWDVGTTEAGSSGSGLIVNSSHQLIGTLTGGAATCADPVNDYFAMLNKQWSYYSASNMQLAIWWILLVVEALLSMAWIRMQQILIPANCFRMFSTVKSM
ncbi:hypothetical protein [Prolixibacter bellariivorans]|uniref:hypothetical protein n=1 Tax=Prolixibacter bellariivorans TaxID=314319 RepID=UPI00131F2768|nr:hypothetical protein [Prolixibacter bellariivorans]